MAVFTPPANATENPPYLDDSTPMQKALWRHMRSKPVGRNVYLYSDSTVSEVAPDGITTFWRQEEGSPYLSGKSTLAQAFYGGHDGYNITSAQSTALTGAGYTVS